MPKDDRRFDHDELRSWFLTVCAVAILVVVVLRADENVNPYIVVLLGGMMGLGFLRFGGDPTQGDDNGGGPKRNDWPRQAFRRNTPDDETEDRRMVGRESDSPEDHPGSHRSRRRYSWGFLPVAATA